MPDSQEHAESSHEEPSHTEAHPSLCPATSFIAKQVNKTCWGFVKQEQTNLSQWFCHSANTLDHVISNNDECCQKKTCCNEYCFHTSHLLIDNDLAEK